MLILLCRFRKEGQEIATRMVFIIRNLPCYRPEIRVYIEKVHIYRYLHALTLQVFFLIDFFYDDNLTVGT